jgi:heat shock protein beta
VKVPKEKDEFDEEEKGEVKESKEDGDDIEVSDEEETPKEPEMEEVTTYEYEQINTDPAIWARDKDDITDEEYQEFWNVVSKGDGGQKAEDWTHFNAE